MKYLKLYEQFRLLRESSDWKEKIEIDGKEYQIEWGNPELELAEIFQTLNHHKSTLPQYLKDSFGSIFNKEMPEEFSHQKDFDKMHINKPLDSSKKGKQTGSNPEIKYSSYELLQLKKLVIDGEEITGDELNPYHNFINEINKAFWEGGKLVRLKNEQIQELADNKSKEEGDNETGFNNVLRDSEFVDKMKIYFDIYVKNDNNPDGIIPEDEIGEYGWVNKLRNGLLDNMKEPKNLNHKKLWNELRKHDENPDKENNNWKDSAQIIWGKLINYKPYFGDTFKYTSLNIKKGGKVTVPAAIELNGKLYLTGGNRRMSFFCYNRVLPTIWTWGVSVNYKPGSYLDKDADGEEGSIPSGKYTGTSVESDREREAQGNFKPGSYLDKDADNRPIQFGTSDDRKVKSDREIEAQGNLKRGNFSD
jgi:hypothetical protein